MCAMVTPTAPGPDGACAQGRASLPARSVPSPAPQTQLSSHVGSEGSVRGSASPGPAWRCARAEEGWASLCCKAPNYPWTRTPGPRPLGAPASPGRAGTRGLIGLLLRRPPDCCKFHTDPGGRGLAALASPGSVARSRSGRERSGAGPGGGRAAVGPGRGGADGAGSCRRERRREAQPRGSGRRRRRRPDGAGRPLLPGRSHGRRDPQEGQLLGARGAHQWPHQASVPGRGRRLLQARGRRRLQETCDQEFPRWVPGAAYGGRTWWVGRELGGEGHGKEFGGPGWSGGGSGSWRRGAKWP